MKEEKQPIHRFKLPKTLYLDLRTWRCGDGFEAGCNEDNVERSELGRGETLLANREGYRCCLGQFARQAGVPAKWLLNVGGPEDLEGIKGDFVSGTVVVRGLAKVVGYNDFGFPVMDVTSFSRRAMEINDGRRTTVEEKIELLTKLCRKHGHKLVVRNRQLLKKGKK